MKFTKMQGVGNDFIIINNIEEKIPQEKFSALAKRLCMRRLSVGADGMMIVDKAEEDGDYRMHFYNADGSLGEMCGNGARCIARYGYENTLAGETQRIETTAGLVIGQRKSERMYTVRLNDITKFVQNMELDIDGQSIICDYAELGNPGLPHAVVPLTDRYKLETESEPKLTDLNEMPKALKTRLLELGEKIRYSKAFPKGTNVNFCRIIGENEIEELTYERGVEEFTLACGTGTASVVAALALRGLVSGENTKVHVPGGELYITLEYDIEKQNESFKSIQAIYLTGTTNIVAKGELCDEDAEI